MTDKGDEHSMNREHRVDPRLEANSREAPEDRNDADERMNGLIADVREEVTDLRERMERLEDDSTDAESGIEPLEEET